MSDDVEGVEIEPVEPASQERRPVAESDLQAMLDREKRGREAERAAREAAEARATRAEQEALQARGLAGNEAAARFRAEEASVDGMIEAAEGEVAALEGRLAQLLAEGNHADAAKVQVAVGRATARIDRLQGQKEALEAAKAVKAAQPARVERPAAPEQPQIDWRQYTAGQRRWINQHPEYLTDERLRTRLAGTHQLFVSDGGEVDTPEYYDALDEAFEKHTGAAARPQRQAAAAEPEPRARSAAAVPVARRSAPGNGSERPGVIRLSPDEREAADIAMPDIPEADYQVAGVMKPGRYRIYAESRERQKKGA